MKVIIIEDEKPAAQKLVKALSACDDSVEVLAILSSVSESVAWLQQHPSPELIFMDIELSDGTSFRIFDQLQVNCPVIFATAYDEYWQEAFEHHGIDYLLKPVRQEKLLQALKKYEKLRQHFSVGYQQLSQYHQAASTGYRKKFLVKRGMDYVSIKTGDIAYFYATHKLVCLVESNGQKFILDDSLADIEKQLDPLQFYRVNRKYLVQSSAIKRIKAFPKSRLQLEIDPAVEEDVIVSQESVPEFKRWMNA